MDWPTFVGCVTMLHEGAFAGGQARICSARDDE
jgi:hypothetical protein